MKTILIVEDDVNLCGGVKLYLEKKGYQVLCAHSLHEARRITDKGAETIALMLLDCNLPDGDGMEFCTGDLSDCQRYGGGYDPGIPGRSR